MSNGFSIARATTGAQSEVVNEVRHEGFTAQISGRDSVRDPSGVRGYPGVCIAIIGSAGASAKYSERQTFA